MIWARAYDIMKKLLLFLLSVTLILSFTACGNKNTASGSESSSDKSNQSVSAVVKTLVVYFSATGSTRAVAEAIAESANADIFEIVPQDPYTSGDLNWNDENSRVTLEHNDESLRNVPLVKSVPDNWEKYDTVYIGYPIWWGIAAWPADSFVGANDFTGKTVIPFCTSASSGLGNSGEMLKTKAGSGDWKDGKRFSSGASKTEVAKWVSDLS